jgi:RNA-directed DNA polymerase
MSFTTPMSQKSRQLELPLESGGEAPMARRSEDGEVASQRTGDPGNDQPPTAESATATLMELIVERENCLRAFKRVRSNGGSPGIDGMRVEDLKEYLQGHWGEIRASLLDGTYRPAPVRRQEIPKSGGGVRQLGIPTVLDRFIQQCILQVLEPLYDPTFSESSYGYRPGRSAIAAVEQAQRYLQSGRTWAVEIDLEKFFDRVNHDMLMGRVAKRISDKRLLKVLRGYLNAGVLADGVVIERSEGTPQGGPLSPLLANILLDDIDRQLEKSGHHFVRYADDLTVYVKSPRAGERVLDRLRKLFGALRLSINESKSGVRPLAKHSLLSYGFWVAPGKVVRLRVSAKAVKGFRRRVRKLTRRNRGQSLKRMLAELAAYLIGWRAYFGRAETPKIFAALDKWIARRVRAYQLKQWKRGTTAYAALRALGVGERVAKAAAAHVRSWWAIAKHGAMNAALPRERLLALGLPLLGPRPLPLFESPDT